MTQNDNQHIQRVVESRRFLDTRHDQPAFVDEVLPTTSRNLLVLRRGRVRAPRGTIVGSLRLTGSFRPFAGHPGSFSLRVTRVSLYSGSRDVAWFIRHSRSGTHDIIQFPAPGQEVLLGGPMNPIYSFGPGTVFFGWLGNYAGSIGSKVDYSQHIEGFVG